VLQCVVVCCSVLQCMPVCRDVLQYVAVCGSASQPVAVPLFYIDSSSTINSAHIYHVLQCNVLQRVAAYCSVLQRVAACCSVLVAACCSADMCLQNSSLIAALSRARTIPCVAVVAACYSV
jgi:hypothetical protein